MGGEDTKEGEQKMRILKVRMFPNLDQKAILRKWIGTSQYLYNKALEAIKKGKKRPNFQKLRNELIHTEDWMKEIPNTIWQGGVKQLANAYKSSLAKGKRFEIRF
jgi:hypothetical protein